MTPMDSGRTIGDPHGPDISSLLAMTLPFPPGLHISVNILHGFVFNPSWIFWDLKFQILLGGQLVAPMDSERTIGDQIYHPS